jgi:hypothetical protein
VQNKINYTALAVLTIFFSLSSFFVKAQPNFSWVHHVQGSNEEYLNRVTTDAQGNVFAAGTFYDTITLPGGQVLASPYDKSTMYVTKQNSSGNVLWVKTMYEVGLGPNGGSSVTGLEVDAAGNVYLSGTVYDTIDVDPGSGEFLVGGIESQGFLCKLDAQGNFVWAKAFSSNGSTSDVFLAIHQNNFYLAFSFRDSVDVDPSAADLILQSAGGYDAAMIKLDSAGSLLWAKKVGGPQEELVYGIATDNNGQMYVTGGFDGTCDFHPGNQIVNLNSAGALDVFILILNSNGSYEMAKRFGGPGNDYGNGIKADNDGNMYVTGGFEDSVDFQPGVGVYMLTSEESADGFVAKLDTAGSLTWARQLAGLSYNYATSIEIDNAGRVYTTGYYSQTIDYDISAGLDTFSVELNVGSGTYLHALDQNGNYLWARQMVCANGTVSILSVHKRGSNFYMTGGFQSTVDFNPGTGTENRTSYYDKDGFLLKLSNCSSLASTFTTSACNSYTWVDGNTYTASTNSPTYTYTNSNGCDSVVTLDLTISNVDVSVTDNSPVLSANANNASYQWLDCSNVTPVANQTAQNFTATQNGSYAVQVIQNGCVDTSACFNVSGVGIENVEAAENVVVFPNPNNGNFVLRIENDQKFSSVRIYDITGRKILESILNNNKVLLTEFPKGVYLAEFITNEYSITKRILVE